MSFYREPTTWTITRANGADVELDVGVKMYERDEGDKTIIVRSSATVSVYAINDDNGTGGDAYQVLPTSQLGTEYHVASYRPRRSRSSFISMSALDTPNSLIIQTPAGNISVELKPYESYRYDDTDDLSGVIISGNEVFTVISGSRSGIPSDGDGEDGVISQLLSTNLWGTKYCVFPFADLNSGFVYRVFAGAYSTTLLFSNGSSVPIQPNAFFQGDASGNAVVSFQSSNPVMVAQYMKGYNKNSRRGDASMSIVPPVSSYANNVTFPTFKYYLDTNRALYYINVVTKCENMDDLVLDGDASLATWSNRLTSDNGLMCCVRGQIWDDITNPSYHSVTSLNPDATFFVSVYSICGNWPASYVHTALGSLQTISSTIAPVLTISTGVMGTTERTKTETTETIKTYAPDVTTHFNIWVLIVASVAALLIIIILIVIVWNIIIWKRRQMNNEPDKEANGRPNRNQELSIPDHTYDDPADGAIDMEHLVPNMPDEVIASSKHVFAWENLELTDTTLGKGSFGVVHLARVYVGDKWVESAVKTLKHGASETERVLFKKEFDIMTKIGYHPNVVHLLGSCEHAGSFYVILEYIQHDDLRTFLRKCRNDQLESGPRREPAVKLTPDQLLNLAVGVAKGMKHISDCGVIHRDLAARNVLVAQGNTPKVADFGLSREHDEDDLYVQKSSMRVPFRWLAIESLTRQEYSTKSDVWSYGILLWEIATYGGTPYPSIRIGQLVRQLERGYRMPKPENCEEEMYKLMQQCWDADPDARPSFEDIVDILTNMSAQDKIYMATHHYANSSVLRFRYPEICPERDDH